jgi:indolepyruvate ferredoxin oxidoreductase beta subunit
MLKEQIIVSGIGGQGVLFLTRVIAQVAVDRQIPVLTSETHGMAQRGGTVLSSLKIGDFASPLIRNSQADVGLLLWDRNMEVHRPLLKQDGALVVNSPMEGAGMRIDATQIARDLGNSVLANLVLLGFAVSQDSLFCEKDECIEAIQKLAPPKYLDQNLHSFYQGLQG